ncbi:MAG TPA: alpha-glucan family phosphorylase, partial [Candidatus Thermoplasmatota archaeon]
RGYFRQHLDADGNQTEVSALWDPAKRLQVVDARVHVEIEGRPVVIRAWRRDVVGVHGHVVPVYLLDTDVRENDAQDRGLTDELYGGDSRYRLAQEAVLGLGGFRLLEALGRTEKAVFHLNEGHSALLSLARWEKVASSRPGRSDAEILEEVRRQCVFTTHTPVAAGHDECSEELARSVLGPEMTDTLARLGCLEDHNLNMTSVALRFARYVNGVSQRHQSVSQAMFPRAHINAVTNGVHAGTWTAPAFQRLFDAHFPNWRQDNHYLRYAVAIPLAKIQRSHTESKEHLMAEIRRRAKVDLDPKVFTIGFARRATPYKRAELLFGDLERLATIGNKWPLQIVFAGKAHPRDEGGKDQIRHVYAAAKRLPAHVRVVYLEEYDVDLAKSVVAGVDLWLNTPEKPREASGTSGMKAALNGVPSFSTHDGWWIEGAIEGVTGWTIGAPWQAPADAAAEQEDLYAKLENTILPLFHNDPSEWAEVMRSAIGINGSFFSAQRMLAQYVDNAYNMASSWSSVRRTVDPGKNEHPPATEESPTAKA